MSIKLACLGFVGLEVLAFAAVASAIGVLPALGLVLLGPLAGALMLRRQRLALAATLAANGGARRMRADTLAAVGAHTGAALLLILPGFVTDLAALLLLIRPLRRIAWRALQRRIGDPLSPPGSPVAARNRTIELESGDYASRPSANPRARGGPAPR